jgi:hypothetical protein
MDFQKWIYDIILKETQYEGNTEPGQKIISASDFGNDILQIYYRYKYGVPKKEIIGQDTIGTVVHKGMEALLSDYEDVETELSLEKEFDNGWKLSGTIDIVHKGFGVIADIKVTKAYTLEKVQKEPLHQYTLQLNVYRYLYEHLKDAKINKLHLIAFLKDGGFDFRKMENKPSFQVLEVQKIPDEEIEKRFNEIAKAIEEYESLGIEPPQCSDVWLRKTKEGAIPIRCAQYCAYNNLCKYYNPKPTKVVGLW